MKKITMITVLFLLATPLAWSAEKMPPANSEIRDAGNKFCQVSGDKVSKADSAEYAGKRYGLCCKMCANKFKKNPAKYLAQMATQEANPAQAPAHDWHMQ